MTKWDFLSIFTLYKNIIMKKLVAFLAIVSLVSCGGDSSTNSNVDSTVVVDTVIVDSTVVDSVSVDTVVAQ